MLTMETYLHILISCDTFASMDT